MDENRSQEDTAKKDIVKTMGWYLEPLTMRPGDSFSGSRFTMLSTNGSADYP